MNHKATVLSILSDSAALSNMSDSTIWKTDILESYCWHQIAAQLLVTFGVINIHHVDHLNEWTTFNL